MPRTRIDFNELVSSINNAGDDDLKFNLPSSIPRPPVDKRCECCGRRIGGFDFFCESDIGNLYSMPFEETLVLKLRRTGPYDEEAKEAVNGAEIHLADAGSEGNNLLQLMINNYGRKKGKKLYCSYQAYNQVAYSWECLDCVILNYEEHHNKLKQRLELESDND